MCPLISRSLKPQGDTDGSQTGAGEADRVCETSLTHQLRSHRQGCNMKLCGVSRACAPSPSGLCPKLQVVSQTDFTSTCVCVCVCVCGGEGWGD